MKGFNPSNMISEFSFPTTIVFGPGAIQTLGERVQDLGGRRVQIVTDPGLVRTGLIDRLQQPLEQAGVEWFLFEGVDSNPVDGNVADGVAHFRDHDGDSIVGVGGGSAMDVAKGIRIQATHSLPLVEYTTEYEGWTRITPDLPPLITVPTTAGTGSEVGRGAVITMAATGRKALIFSPHLLANVALCDPELTVGLPPSLTAWTGADALTHNVESYLSRPFHPLCEGIALQGVRWCFAHLPRAVAQGEDMEARQGMMMAALMGGIAFQKDLGAAHSLSHPLSVHCGLNHGLANALALPPVLRFNRSVSAAKMADLARALGEDTAGQSEDQQAAVFINRVEELLRQIGIPGTLTELGRSQVPIDRLVDDAVADPCHPYNPRPCTAEDFRRLYEEIL